VCNTALMSHCQNYLNNRTADYSMRRARFAYMADVLFMNLTLSYADRLFDLGAGHCQFDYYLRTERKWHGVYVPIDGAIDGTDLNTWSPTVQPDVYVLSEVLEHLHHPFRLLKQLRPKKGIVLTVPNPDTVDVLGCDPDHKTVVTCEALDRYGFHTSRHSFFGKKDDTLLAWMRFR
jgi:hypothetical protein